jgi:hypothetical protein
LALLLCWPKKALLAKKKMSGLLAIKKKDAQPVPTKSYQGLSILVKRDVDSCKSKSLDTGTAALITKTIRCSHHDRRRSKRLSDADIIDISRRVSLQFSPTTPPASTNTTTAPLPPPTSATIPPAH